MTDHERIQLLEKALIKYVELYGFIDEARNYYCKSNANVRTVPPAHQN